MNNEITKMVTKAAIISLCQRYGISQDKAKKLLAKLRAVQSSGERLSKWKQK